MATMETELPRRLSESSQPASIRRCVRHRPLAVQDTQGITLSRFICSLGPKLKVAYCLPSFARQIVYNHQVFNSKEEFLEAFDKKELNISSYPPIDPNWAARYRKGPLRDLGQLAGPRTIPFSGLRFRVDAEQQFISWMGWEFYLGFDRDMVSRRVKDKCHGTDLEGTFQGMSLWNIKFLNDRIIYELSPQEGEHGRVIDAPRC